MNLRKVLIKDVRKYIYIYIKRSKMVKQRYQLIPSKNIDDQSILQSDRKRSKPGHIQPKMVVSGATLF